MMRFDTYLRFNGSALAAMTFYQTIFGGEMTELVTDDLGSAFTIVGWTWVTQPSVPAI